VTEYQVKRSENADMAALTPKVRTVADEHARLQGLLDRVHAGCPEAAQLLHQEYGAHIVRAVRRRLPRLLRPKFDSLDFVQDVWASFYRAPHNFNSPEHLVAFLTRVAQAKVIDATRQGLQTLKRDVRREESLDAPQIEATPKKVFAREATPSENAIGNELWERLLEGQPLAYQKVLMHLRDGQTQEQVAAELNLHRRTVHRILARALEKAHQ
jgi:RNA polymerase sigma factor (sigma-70 family)